MIVGSQLCNRTWVCSNVRKYDAFNLVSKRSAMPTMQRDIDVIKIQPLELG